MDYTATKSVLTLLLIVLMLTPLLAGAQSTVETQKGLPPDPNATSPEYARPQPTPERPALGPAPGKPTLDPKLAAGAERRQSGGLAQGAFLRLWPALLLGAGAGVLVFAAANARRRTRRNGRL
jgi:hypothetical protein